MGLGFLGVQIIFLLGQDDIIRSRDGALEGVTKASIVLGQTGSRKGLGNAAGRLEYQSSARKISISRLKSN